MHSCHPRCHFSALRHRFLVFASRGHLVFFPVSVYAQRSACIRPFSVRPLGISVFPLVRLRLNLWLRLPCLGLAPFHQPFRGGRPSFRCGRPSRLRLSPPRACSLHSLWVTVALSTLCISHGVLWLCLPCWRLFSRFCFPVLLPFHLPPMRLAWYSRCG